MTSSVDNEVHLSSRVQMQTLRANFSFCPPRPIVAQNQDKGKSVTHCMDSNLKDTVQKMIFSPNMVEWDDPVSCFLCKNYHWDFVRMGIIMKDP